MSNVQRIILQIKTNLKNNQKALEILVLFIFVLRVFYVFDNFHDFYQIYQIPYFFGIISKEKCTKISQLPRTKVRGL